LKEGILGGTFDPIHNGHLEVAREARTRLGLDQVLFVPASCPRLRETGPVAAPEQRVHMVRLAIGDVPYYGLSTVEIERPGPSCTVDTVAELVEQIGPADEFFLILGWDNLAELPRWREPARLIKLCRIAAVPRPGYVLPDLEALARKVPGLKERVTLLDGPHIDLSASEIRRRVCRGLPIAHLVPAPVADYIKEQRLYLDLD
jgi:nicotinate-nucleotide adenylyltransferase